MPLYEYQCESCEHRFEKIQKYTDPAPDACPKCGGAVRKLASSPAIQFKGSGWYITDYAKKSGTEGGTSGGGKAEGSDSTSSSGSEASSKTEKPASNKSDASAKSESAPAKSDTSAATKNS
jgi:putative FmdB family regulatory protein